MYSHLFYKYVLVCLLLIWNLVSQAQDTTLVVKNQRSFSQMDAAIVSAAKKGKKEIRVEICKGKYTFRYWRDDIADGILHDYVKVLRVHWTEQMVVEDLKGETARLMNSSGNWSTWTSHMRNWIEDIKKWGQEDIVSVQQSGTILPDALFNNLQSNIQSLCKQINASYEKKLYDCTAVIMRRLLESLLVLCYQKLGIEAEIMDKSGLHHITLDKMIKNAEQNKTMGFSANTRKEMVLFKDLGNYSAHKIWYNCTQQDIKPHILKYRVIIEELMYKSGVKK